MYIALAILNMLQFFIVLKDSSCNNLLCCVRGNQSRPEQTSSYPGIAVMATYTFPV